MKEIAKTIEKSVIDALQKEIPMRLRDTFKSVKTLKELETMKIGYSRISNSDITL